ncbi:MAG: hypothetical protein U1E20_04235 [Methylocystis sp.]|uniref:hypothetical protein n=1 Tax=Methylocystis sp. TaxID=1911079 RepID=UPI00393F8778
MNSDAPNTPDTDFKVAMTPEEIEMLSRHLVSGVSYLEFGSGGSTIFALERGARRCLSVESDPAWVDKLRQNPVIRQAESNGRLTINCVDIGPVMDWGMPANRSRLELWPNYFLPVWEKLDWVPEVVLIDGRFRTACGLASFLVCPETTAILMHDFYDALSIRKNYRSLLDVADIVEQQTNLVSLRRKPNVTATSLLSRLSAVWSDFA